MCRLAAQTELGVEASPLELDRGGPSYTADTLEQIHACKPDAELTFIVGADTALTMPGWRRPEQVLGLARLAVAGRPGSDGSEVTQALASIPMQETAGLPRARPEVVFLTMAPIAASSSEARERIAAGRGVEDLLVPAVARYIAEHGLYGGRR